MASVPTVRIEHPGFPDGVVINASDFDPERDRRYGEAAPVAAAAVNLREVGVRALPAALSEVSDAALLRSLIESDDRAGAVALYEKRLAELEG